MIEQRPYITPLFLFESIPCQPGKAATLCDTGDSGGPILGWNAMAGAWELVGLVAHRSFAVTNDQGQPIILTSALDLTHPLLRTRIAEYVRGR
jgi:hypothetical protein